MMINQDNNRPDNDDDEEEGGTSTVIKNKVELPKKYKVLLHNDDYTTMEFVIFILQGVFHKTIEEAEKIMMEVHRTGIGLCGIYTFEIAESKSKKVERLAREHAHPLMCSIEPE
ncbi:MAG: ATP-dependent Clp protease adaptor ClpS [Bacteriovorax sp.]|nr:ATP-dependent Clp protease adaptor ClpS [Bacteriovorax sp.]